MCRVLLNSIEKAKRFVGIASGFEVGASLKSGRYIIDAKSIMGIFSLDLTKPMELVFDKDTNCDERVIADYMEQIKEFAI